MGTTGLSKRPFQRKRVGPHSKVILILGIICTWWGNELGTPHLVFRKDENNEKEAGDDPL